MMRRQAFALTMLGGLAMPAGAGAYAAELLKPAHLGYVWVGARGGSPDLDGLLLGLADRGYAVGRNLLIEERYTDGHPERLSGDFAELLARNVDVLITAGFQLTLAAQRATSTVPIVSVTDDPVGAGLVASRSRPGGNITGVSLFSDEYAATWLELLKDAVPTPHRVAVLWSPDSPIFVREVERVRKTASGLGLEVTAFSARPEETDACLGAIATARPDGLVICDDPFLSSIGTRLMRSLLNIACRTLYAGSAAYAREGGLMSYSANYFGLCKHAAGYVDRTLKGERPSALPIEQSMDFQLLMNLNTAKALGLAVPYVVLQPAEEVTK
jgi:putative tryptophan/tyrosine transport system substrate-binding protein